MKRSDALLLAVLCAIIGASIGGAIYPLVTPPPKVNAPTEAKK
jgi:hypothetical protein